MRWPDTFITSSTRPSSHRSPSSSFFAPSPAKYTPSKRDQYVCRYRSGSPQMPRSIDGHGSVSTRKPPPPSGTGLPSLSTTSALMPGNGVIAAPGFVDVMPGSGVIMMAPVSVCHQVSTTGVRPPPTYVRYQIHASGLIGSPTDPSTRNDDRSYGAISSCPHFINVRIVVGAV